MKIISGSSNPSASTVALVKLCNRLNEAGCQCTFYGADRWHRDKCPAAGLDAFRPQPNDVVVVHNLRLLSRKDLHDLPAMAAHPAKSKWTDHLKKTALKHLPSRGKPDNIKLVFTWRPNDLFSPNQVRLSLFDKLHFVTDTGKDAGFQRYPHFTCPDLLDTLTSSPHKPTRVAGVIGSIRKENDTHTSTLCALQDGMDKVILYGYLFDPLYYYGVMKPLIDRHPGRIQFAGFLDDRQKLYDCVSDVYHCDKNPCSVVREECRVTNTRYHGPQAPAGQSYPTNETILDIWRTELGV